MRMPLSLILPVSLAILMGVCTLLLSPGTSAAVSPVPPTALDIMNRTLPHADDYADLSLNYTFLIDVLNEVYERSGRLKKQLNLLERIYHYYGRRFVRKLTVNKQPLEGEALMVEDRRETVFRGQTNAAVARGEPHDLNDRLDNGIVYLSTLIPRYTYTIAGFDTLHSRASYKITFVPKPDLDAESRRDKIFNHMTGTVWVEKESFRILKITAHLVDNVRFGMIAANVTQTDIVYKQQQVQPDVWMPKMVEAHISGSVFFFKHFNRRFWVDFHSFEQQTNPAPVGFERWSGQVPASEP